MSDDVPPQDQPPPAVTAAADHLPLPLVPPGDSRRFREIFDAAQPAIAAELTADTRDERELVGTRGSATAAWSMSFRAGACDIVLDLVQHREAIQLNGQLLCPDPTVDGVVRVFSADALVTSASTDEFGQFELGELPLAVYTVSVARPDHVIEFPVDLSERSAS